MCQRKVTMSDRRSLDYEKYLKALVAGLGLLTLAFEYYWYKWRPAAKENQNRDEAQRHDVTDRRNDVTDRHDVAHSHEMSNGHAGSGHANGGVINRGYSKN